MPIKFSIITITFNHIEGLKKTIQSVSNQNYKFKEHIIIDGNSTDGTKNFLEMLEVKFISEPDRGIYDAMNKGIKKAKGDYVIFMNAGDTFNSKNVLVDFTTQNFKADVIYGNCYVEYAYNYGRLLKPNDLKSLWKGMSFSHQTVFVKTKLLQNNLFDINYKFCADFNQIYGFYLNGKKFTYWNNTISNIEAGGVSDAQRYISTYEVFKINKKCSPHLKIYFYFLPKIIYSFVIVKLKRILPTSIIKKITQLKYR